MGFATKIGALAARHAWVGASFLGLIFSGAAWAQQQTPAQTGDTQTVQQTFGAWLMICEVKLSAASKFCSFFTTAKDASGKTIATMVVSTDKKGAPIGMISMQPGIALNQPLTIELIPPRSTGGTLGTSDTEAPKKLKLSRLVPTGCDVEHCFVLWGIGAVDIQALHSGRDLVLSFKTVPADKLGPLILAPAPRLPMKATITTAGFKDAVEASLK